MKTAVRWVLRVISLIAFGLSLLSAWMFYVFYLKWAWVFEDGRYFDPVEDVVYHDTSSVWGVISFVLLLIAIALWLVASKIKNKRDLAQPTALPPPIVSEPGAVATGSTHKLDG
jgi:cbb3-type cytochrome oxidase subunit 3